MSFLIKTIFMNTTLVCLMYNKTSQERVESLIINNKQNAKDDSANISPL